MSKITGEVAARMLEVVDRTTNQGRITYLAIAFMFETRLAFSEAVRLTVQDVYRLGIVRKSFQVGHGPREKTVLLTETARETVAKILTTQHNQGLPPFPWAPLLRTPAGVAFTGDQLARLFWIYREAAEAS